MSFSSSLTRGAMDILGELQLLTAKTMEKVEVVKQYEVIRELGKGTYGRVDLAIHRVRGTKMALKFLRKKTTKQRSFLQEFCISRYLCVCPYIIGMYDIAFETDEYYVFAQEYAVAGDLFDIIPPQDIVSALRFAVWTAANLFFERYLEESPLKSMGPLTFNGKPPLSLSDATCWSLQETGLKQQDSPLECIEP
ncbi:hypothetical protein FKM82_007795 [Ascaphus truei]